MERKVRLTTGLILFAYAASHFLGHATGIFGLAAMESIGRGIILAPWRTPPARVLLAASLLVHGGLGVGQGGEGVHGDVVALPNPQFFHVLPSGRLCHPYDTYPSVWGKRCKALTWASTTPADCSPGSARTR